MGDLAAEAPDMRPLERVERALEATPVGVDADAPFTPQAARAEASIAAAAPVVEAAPAVPMKSPLREDIEDVLADGLEATYAGLPPAVQAEFRERGEALAAQFESMVSRNAVRLRTAHDGIVRWLHLLPTQGKCSRHFFVQEAKVKTDRILALRAGTK